MVRYLKEWPRFLLTVPLSIRLGIVTLCSVLCMAIHLLTFPLSHNGSLLAIPIGVAAWLFKKQGLFICFTACLVVLVVYHTLRLGSLWWPAEFALFFWGGEFILLIVGLIMSTLRALVDSADAARLQAEQAQRQTALAYEHQRKVNELKDQFLLHASHELRTPLTTLGGSLELLQEYLEQLDPVKQAQMLDKALASYEELVNLVNRVLDAARVASDIPGAQSEVVCVHQLLQEVLAHLDPGDGETYTISLQVPEHIMVWADPELLRQVLRNLLSNIFKYVPARTEIRIEAAQAAPSSPVCLAVQDAGPGIPAEELPLLFEKFVRLKRDLAGPTRGTGLGLYICRRLVAAMGGHIWVESSGRLGEGSRFCVTLPSVSVPTSN